jgi:cytidylate kinase
MRIIISGMAAVGKSTLARSISKKYNLGNCSAGDLLKCIARRLNYNPDGANWWETEEGSSFHSLRRSDLSLDREMDRQVKEILDKGNVVVTARAMPWLYDNKRCVKIWLKASKDIRARRMMMRDKISFDQALRSVMRRDRNDKKLLLNLYGIRLEKDLSPFDMVLSTQRLSATDVRSVVLNMVGRLSI